MNRSICRSLLALVALSALAPGCASMGTPKVIYLARHGQTEWNRVGRFQGDPDLDAVGYVNRLSLWMLLRDRPLDSIYTSEAQRTQRTAEPLAMHQKLRIQPRAALNEINGGVMVGVCFADIAPERASAHEQECRVAVRGSRPEVTIRQVRAELRGAQRMRLQDRLPLGENYYDIDLRVTPFLEELQRGAREREVLIVGHGVVNRVLMHRLMGWPMEVVSFLRQENDQVYRLETDGEGKVVRLDLYTPGFGWQTCHGQPQPGQKGLDCNPGPPPAASRPAGQPAVPFVP